MTLALLFAAACGAGAGGDDESGEPEPWLALDSPVLKLASDESHVYFSDAATVRRVALSGGEPETLHELADAGASYMQLIEKIYIGPTQVAIVWSQVELVAPYSGELHLAVVPKAGGAALILATSADSRAFLGAYFHGDYLYFSSNTSVLRVPVAGGEVEFVAESPGPVLHWIYSPIVRDDELVWAEDDQLFRMSLDDDDQEGEVLASLPGVGKIVGHDADRYIVALSPAMAFQEPANAFVEVDATSGAVAEPVALVAGADEMAVAGPDVWVARWADGLFRYPLAGGAPDHVLAESVFAVTAADGAVFAATETAIWRILD